MEQDSDELDDNDNNNIMEWEEEVPFLHDRSANAANAEDEDEDVDLLFLLLLTTSMRQELDESIDLLHSQLKEQIRLEKRLNRLPPEKKERTSWLQFNEKITDEHFRRMFRMDRLAFDSLCHQICSKIGEEQFRSEAHLNNGGMSEQKTKAAQQRTGGCTPGEIKLAVAIRLLAGGSCLDLIPLFDMVKSSTHKTFEQVVRWVLCTFEFPLPGILRREDWSVLHEFAHDFDAKSGGHFYGTFGALDGVAIRINSPSLKEVPDPGNYYCRKGFCALNVQAICDKHKRFLWAHPMNKGSTHDSMAFGGTRLLDLLKEHAVKLKEQGLFPCR